MLWFVGVYLLFLFLFQNIDCGYSFEPPSSAILTCIHNVLCKNKKKNIKQISTENIQVFQPKKNIYITWACFPQLKRDMTVVHVIYTFTKFTLYSFINDLFHILIHVVCTIFYVFTCNILHQDNSGFIHPQHEQRIKCSRTVYTRLSRIMRKSDLAKTMTQISCAVTVQLVSVF